MRVTCHSILRCLCGTKDPVPNIQRAGLINPDLYSSGPRGPVATDRRRPRRRDSTLLSVLTIVLAALTSSFISARLSGCVNIFKWRAPLGRQPLT